MKLPHTSLEDKHLPVMIDEVLKICNPKNGGNLPWGSQDTAKFEKEWSMKPVKLHGFLDFNRDVQILKYKDGEKGVDVVTPFYTHLDKEEKLYEIVLRYLTYRILKKKILSLQKDQNN